MCNKVLNPRIILVLVPVLLCSLFGVSLVTAQDTTQVWTMTYGRSEFTTVRFDPAPPGDRGGWHQLCHALPTVLPDTLQWTFELTIPESSDSCDDPRCTLARVDITLLGDDCSDSLHWQHEGADLIFFHYDACNSVMALIHYRYLNDYTDILRAPIPDPPTGKHTFQVYRSAEGAWFLYVDGIRADVAHYEPFPAVSGDYVFYNIYCSGVTFRPYEPFDPPPEWAYPVAVSVGDKPALDDAERLSAYPNPTPSATYIRYHAMAPGVTKLRILDAAGRVIRTTEDEVLGSGREDILWDGRDDANRPVPSGIYYYRLNHAGSEEQGRIVITR